MKMFVSIFARCGCQLKIAFLSGALLFFLAHGTAAFSCLVCFIRSVKQVLFPDYIGAKTFLLLSLLLLFLPTLLS